MPMTVVVNGVSRPVSMVGVTDGFRRNSPAGDYARALFRSGRHDFAQQGVFADAAPGGAGFPGYGPGGQGNTARRTLLHGDWRVSRADGDVWRDGNQARFGDRADRTDQVLHRRRLPADFLRAGRPSGRSAATDDGGGAILEEPAPAGCAVSRARIWVRCWIRRGKSRWR